MSKAYLILENGTVFEGESFGAEGVAVGEVVFTTSMTGYLETLTDPSFCGQIVVQTFPLIGNYGVIPSDFESNNVYLKAYIVRECCQEPSNFRCNGVLDTFLKENNIIGLKGIDTRALTRIVREHGVMNAMISTKRDISEKQKKEINEYRIENPVSEASNHEPYTVGEGNIKIALYDFGTKKAIAKELAKRGCEVRVFDSKTSADEILAYKPDGVMLSNGPGDPLENSYQIEQIKLLTKKRIPIFGICLGHQLLAVSQGAKTIKMKYGHRGENQPALDIENDRVYITSQNHGYEVLSDSLPKGASLSFKNVNDGTCEGIKYINFPAFSVQFHPEACGGPLDTSFLFDKFIELIEEVSFNAAE